MSTLSTYSRDFAKENDPDRFFLSLLAPAERQADLWPLIAFNVEIAKTREVVTDTTIGLIRLQWWRDALDKIYAGGEVLQNAILPELSRVIQKYNLPKDLFDTLIYGREFDLEDVLPANMDGLVHYTDYTHAPLLKLMLQVLGSDKDARDLAVAYSLTGLLRTVIYHARARRCYLPEDLLQKNNVSVYKLYDLKPQDDLSAVVADVVAKAREYLEKAVPQTGMERGMKKLAALYLKQMDKCGCDPFNPDWIRPLAFKELRVALAARTTLFE